MSSASVGGSSVNILGLTSTTTATDFRVCDFSERIVAGASSIHRATKSAERQAHRDQCPQDVGQRLLDGCIGIAVVHVIAEQRPFAGCRLPRQCGQVDHFDPLIVGEEWCLERLQQATAGQVGGTADERAVHQGQGLRNAALILGRPARQRLELLQEFVTAGIANSRDAKAISVRRDQHRRHRDAIVNLFGGQHLDVHLSEPLPSHGISSCSRQIQLTENAARVAPQVSGADAIFDRIAQTFVKCDDASRSERPSYATMGQNLFACDRVIFVVWATTVQKRGRCGGETGGTAPRTASALLTTHCRRRMLVWKLGGN